MSSAEVFCKALGETHAKQESDKYVKPKTRFKKLDEFYVAVDGLSEWLKREGHPDEGQELHTLMHETAWTTSSELLGELMLALDKMKGKYSQELRAEINECREFARHHRKILGLS